MITEDNYKDYETLYEIKNKRIYYKNKVKKIKQLTFIGLSTLNLIIMYNLGKITNYLATSTIDKLAFDSFLTFMAIVGIGQAYKISDSVRDKYNLKYFKEDHPNIDTEMNDYNIKYELEKYNQKINSKSDEKFINKESYYDKKVTYQKEEDFFEYIVMNRNQKEKVKVKQKSYK